MQLSKNFVPSDVEEKWYRQWKSKGYFKSSPDERQPFTIVMPPPNVTGVLHMGHTLNATVQDILCRYARLQGYNVCWVPGSDHASIATEAKVVDMLKKEKGINKNELSREEFLKYAFEWKEKYGNIIYSQLEKLGCSVDWDRTTFTMDDHYYKAVIKVFVDLYKKGFIYRGARMINWDTVAQTALSDEEVEYKDVKGKLYYIKYRVAGTQDYITIATQRPETIMGDVAVCAHPDDDRYKNLKGKHVIVPLIDKEVPVIFDEYVEKDFGTGVLKITPAHDINDFNIGLKYQLPVVDTIDDKGNLSAEAQIFIGEDRFIARKKIADTLKEKGLLIKEEEYDSRIGYSQRTQSVVEPKISTQWFVKMKELAAPALEEVVSENINIHPRERFLATYKHWLENVKDWCISRQLWWGQQIPAWYDDAGNVYVGNTEDEARTSAGLDKDARLVQDADVLDTWFSSWLWPIEVFKGITEPGNKDFKYYYPTSVLVTGQDIIFFWVARMIMAGLEFENRKPFNDVYFTGMVRDNQGRKMSKSLGNSPDLLALLHQYGADAVRFGIMISSPAGNDLLFDENALEQGRNFNNKIWNALKLATMWSEHESFDQNKTSDKENDFATSWFESRLNEVSAEVANLISQFKLSEALKIIYSLIWDDFCSWYLEWIKPPFGEAINANVHNKTVDFFDRLLQLLHPFMPFITEEIYHQLKERDADLTASHLSPSGNKDKDLLDAGNKLKQLITAVRDAKNKFKLQPKEPISLYINTEDENSFNFFGAVLQKQVNATGLFFNTQPQGNALTVVCGNEKLFIISEKEVDADEQKEKLQSDLNYLKGFLTSVEKKLSNQKFVENAKPEVVELERKKKADAEQKISIIEQSLASMK